MIFSLLDTDLYKFTSSYAYMKMFPDAECTFTYIDRNKTPRTPEFLEELKKELKDLALSTFSEDEFNWCVKNIKFIPQFYWEWLKTFRFEPDRIKCWLDENNVLNAQVTDKCYRCTLYEIPFLYLVPEINNKNKPVDWDITLSILKNKIDMANTNGMYFSEFGTRRRFNHLTQDIIVKTLKDYSKTCVGTSNVYFAMKYNMKPIGTHPHEWFMFHGAQFGYKNANYMALENWVNTYDGDLGIALSDTFTSDVFFKNFSLKLAKLFDGVRQDSGDEYEFIEKTVNFYITKGIDPKSKTIVFSNALDFPKAIDINNHCKDKIKASFGIGTNLTCDVYSEKYNKYPYENEVMKMSDCRMNSNQPWQKTIKLSDDIGKHMGDPYEIKCAEYELGLINKI